MKKITALFSAVIIMIAVCMPVMASDGSGKLSISLRIEGISGNISNKIYQTDKTNMADFIREADSEDDGFEFKIEDSEYGAYVSSINGETAGTFGGYDGWCFLVNGEQSQVGMSSVVLNDGDDIIFYYSCDGMQIPKINTEKIADGIISWTSEDTTYDADWNPVVTENPVSGATVTWYAGDTSRQYTTDGNGTIKIDGDLLTTGSHRIEIEKKGADGEPLVLRYAPDFTVNVDRVNTVPSDTTSDDDIENKDKPIEVISTGDRSLMPFCVVSVLSIAACLVTVLSGKKKVNE